MAGHKKHHETSCRKCGQETPEELLAACRQAGLRRTHLLENVLETLRTHSEPIKIGDLMQARGIRGTCDPATLYRLLQRLESKGLIRRIGLHERAAHFALRRAHHHDYVVCRECGDVVTLNMDCPAEKLETEVGRRTGFREIYHELQFYGVCPRCAAKSA